MKNYLKIVHIDENSLVPKYQQVAVAIIKGVESEIIIDGDILPSIHDFCVALDVSKNTIEKAYNTLKKQGIVASYQGKGYFVCLQKLAMQA
jgi:DNA-binding transcriptional regulator YhcF (GntR family)